MIPQGWKAPFSESLVNLNEVPGVCERVESNTYIHEYINLHIYIYICILCIPTDFFLYCKMTCDIASCTGIYIYIFTVHTVNNMYIYTSVCIHCDT